MLVDHGKVLAKADELFLEAQRQAENIRGKIRWWRISLSELESEGMKHAILRNILTTAGDLHGIIEEMRVTVRWDEPPNRFIIKISTTTAWIPETPLRTLVAPA